MYPRILTIIVFLLSYPTKQCLTQTTSMSALWAKPVHLSASFGSDAIVGLEITQRVYRGLFLHIGYNYFDINIVDTKSDIFSGDLELMFDGTVALSSLHLLFSHSVYRGWLRVYAGPAFFSQNRISAKVQLAESLAFNDLELTPEEVGYGSGIIHWPQQISPCGGISIGRYFTNRKISWVCNVGVYYKGKPTFDMEATNLLRSNVNSERQIEDNLAFFRWWPAINIKVGYKLN